MHQATDKNRGTKILSYKQLKHELDVASLLFRGKETDSNWEVRQAFFTNTRLFLLSDCANDCKDELVAKLHETIPGIYNTIKSIRTTLIEEALSLVEAIGARVGESINMHTNEAILRFLMNESCVTKKATATRTFEATNNYLTKIKFRPKVLTFLCARAQEKNPQLREYAFGYIKTVLSIHGPAHRSRIENADLTQAVADAIQKGLVDAAPTVRTACRTTYYVFEQYWPTAASKLASKLDMTLQRRLGLDNAQVKSAVSHLAKPLRRRPTQTLSPAFTKPLPAVAKNIRRPFDTQARRKSDVLRSPTVSNSNNKSGSSLHRTENPSTSPMTSNSSVQAAPPNLTELPPMATVSIRHPFNTQARRESEQMPSPAVSNSNNRSGSPLHHTENSSASAIESPVASSSSIQAAPPNLTELPPIATTSIHHSFITQARRESDLMPSPTASTSNDTSESSLYHTENSPVSAIELQVDSNSSSQAASPNLAQLSPVAVENIPHPIDTQARRKSGIMPSPTASTDNTKCKARLHYTQKSSTFSIKKPVGRTSLTKTARFVKNSRSVMTPISNTDVPARSGSGSTNPTKSLSRSSSASTKLESSAGSGPVSPNLTKPPSRASSVSAKPESSARSTSVKRSPRPKLKKNNSLTQKYDHIKSRYRDKYTPY
ncbi:suppressor of tub2 mutation [Mucor circinelloides]